MRDFVHACDQANKMRNYKGWCRRCGAPLKVQANGKPRLQIFSDCKNTIKEMSGYKWAEGSEIKDAKDEPLQLNDHTCDCIRYGIYGVEGKFYFSGSDLA